MIAYLLLFISLKRAARRMSAFGRLRSPIDLNLVQINLRRRPPHSLVLPTSFRHQVVSDEVASVEGSSSDVGFTGAFGFDRFRRFRSFFAAFF
jgi:hypothetical protein